MNGSTEEGELRGLVVSTESGALRVDLHRKPRKGLGQRWLVTAGSEDTGISSRVLEEF